MGFWHVIFGEPLELPRRHLDRRLPLFLRAPNIETEARGEEAAGPRARRTVL